MARPRRYFTMPDIYEPNDTVHSSDEFVVPAKNESGETSRLYCHAAPELAGWLDSLVSSGRFPFPKLGDAVRYCVLLGCIQLSKIEADLPNYHEIIESANRVVREKEVQISVMDHIEHFAQLITKLQGFSAWEEILGHLTKERASAQKFRACSVYWSDRWKEELARRFEAIEHLALLKQSESVIRESDMYIDLRPSKAVHEEGEER